MVLVGSCGTFVKVDAVGAFHVVTVHAVAGKAAFGVCAELSLTVHACIKGEAFVDINASTVVGHGKSECTVADEAALEVFTGRVGSACIKGAFVNVSTDFASADLHKGPTFVAVALVPRAVVVVDAGYLVTVA